MNILFIHEVDWLNKVVFDIHTLAEALSLRGHKVFAIDYRSGMASNGGSRPVGLKTARVPDVSRAFGGSKVSLIRPGIINIHGINRVSAAVTHRHEIARTIKREHIDAIVLYSVPTNGLQTLATARKLGVPVVFRSIDVLNQIAAHAYLRPAIRLLEKRVYSRADMILTLTPSLTDYVIAYGARPARVHLLPMPVDTGKFHPYQPAASYREKWGIGSDEKVMLFMGTLFDFSGLDELIPRMPDIIRQVPEARLLVVGDGPQRPKLDRLIAETGQADKITITGFQPYDTMPDYINLAHFCINTFAIMGTTRDIFPGKIVQYLACGKAVLASPLPGLLAITPGEVEGMAYYQDFDDLVEKAVTLLRDDDYRRRLEANALSYVGKVHSVESIAAQLEQRLQEAINAKCTTIT